MVRNGFNELWKKQRNQPPKPLKTTKNEFPLKSFKRFFSLSFGLECCSTFYFNPGQEKIGGIMVLWFRGLTLVPRRQGFQASICHLPAYHLPVIRFWD